MSAVQIGPFTYRVYVSDDIAVVLICPFCKAYCDVTIDAAREGRYDLPIHFFVEHFSHHVRGNHTGTAKEIDRDKVMAALKLMREALE